MSDREALRPETLEQQVRIAKVEFESWQDDARTFDLYGSVEDRERRLYCERRARAAEVVMQSAERLLKVLRNEPVEPVR
jgi:hypothetical protein